MSEVWPAAIRAGFKGICQNYSNRCPALPESCLILKEMPQRGRRFVRTGRNCFHVLRTPKYNKPLGKVKKNLQAAVTLRHRFQSLFQSVQPRRQAGLVARRRVLVQRRPSGWPCRARTRSAGRSGRRRLYRLFPGSRACSAGRCAVARSWPDCGRYVSWSGGRVSAPKNDLPCGLITFVCPGLPQEDVPVGTETCILREQVALGQMEYGRNHVPALTPGPSSPSKYPPADAASH